MLKPKLASTAFISPALWTAGSNAISLDAKVSLQKVLDRWKVQVPQEKQKLNTKTALSTYSSCCIAQQ